MGEWWLLWAMVEWLVFTLDRREVDEQVIARFQKEPKEDDIPSIHLTSMSDLFLTPTVLGDFDLPSAKLPSYPIMFLMVIHTRPSPIVAVSHSITALL